MNANDYAAHELPEVEFPLNLEDVGAKQLWCAVINQALEDAKTAVAKKDHYEIETLRLEINNKWFQQICLMAGMDYGTIKARFTFIFSGV